MKIGGTFMPENRYGFHRTYNFYVEINGIVMSFSRVSGVGRGVSLQSHHEGGMNGRTHFLRGNQEEQTITLEYGVSTDTTALEQLMPGRYLEKGVYINVLNDAFENTKCSYSLSGCYIKNIRFGELSANDSRLVISTLEITYDHMIYGA